MAHEHIIVDTDVSFVIDPITRAITTESSKLYLTQYDHNSEKYTFKIPRIIEGHDISDCDTIMIDFDNANRRKTLVNSGSYKVKEIVAEEDNVLFTWTVSRESTQIAGSLSFSVSFRCYDDDGNIIYEFGTDKFNKITILEKSRYDQTTVTNYPDLIEQIKEDILDVAVTSVNGETPDENGDVSITIPEGFSGSWNDLSDKPFDISFEFVQKAVGSSHSKWFTVDPHNYNPLFIEINGIKHGPLSDYTGDGDSSLWADGGGMGFYIKRSSNTYFVYIDTNRYGSLGEATINMYTANYQQIDHKYLPFATSEAAGVVRMGYSSEDEVPDIMNSEYCYTDSEGKLVACSPKSTMTFSELSISNMLTNANDNVLGIYTTSISDDVAVNFSPTLPVSVRFLHYDYYTSPYTLIFYVESADGKNYLVKVRSRAIQSVEQLTTSSWNDLTDKPFYEEENIIDITGLEFPNIGTRNSETGAVATEYAHNLAIPFALGQTWNVISDVGHSYDLEVQEADNGTLYIGTYPDANDTPFYITPNTITANASFVSNVKAELLTLTGVSGAYVGEPIVHHLDSKYIKDMYHEEPVELFSVENAEFVDNVYMLETPFAIVDGHTYIVNWDGVEYTCEAYIFEGIPAIGNTAELGGKGNGEPFNIGYDSFANVSFVNSFDDLTTHTFSVTEMVRHTIPPKYIKDMYYEEENLVNIAGLEYFLIDPISDGVTEYTYDYIPLELGQTWDIYYNPNSGSFTVGDYSSMQVQEDEDGNLYIGDPEVNTYPFYITNNFIRINAKWYNATKFTVVKIVGVSGTYTDDPIVRQIDPKYLPILEEAQETIFESGDFVVLREYIGPEYGKLLGKYIVSIDGISETVEFIESDEYSSFVETDYYMIHSSNDPDSAEYNKIFMGLRVPDDIVHSVKLTRIKDVIKEEYLPDSVTAKPDWNQSDEASSDYVKNRTHYDDITHYLIDGAFVNLDINQLYTVQIYDDIYENVPVYNAGSNNDPRWGVGDMRVVNYPFGFFKYPCWPSNDIINTEISMISFDRNIYPDATINDVQIYQRILKKLDEKYIPDSVKGMLVTVSEDAEGNLVASNNSEEIIAAYEAGVCVRLEYNRLVHDLTLSMGNMPIFLCMVPNSQTNIGVYMIAVNADYTINVQEESYNIPTIDATLAIEGAAADAKATGDAISAVSALVGDVAVSEQISSALAESAIPTPTTAQVGQLLSVKAVDENGKPTEWEAVDMPTDDHINALIDAKLGVIENGTY